MELFDLDPRQLPIARLYRVPYEGCMTIYDQVLGFTARDTRSFYSVDDDIFVDFGGAVEDHLCWRPTRLSIFISLFANKRHAEYWALKWSARHNGKLCEVFEIDAAKLGYYVFDAEELRQGLSLHVPSGAEASILDEYLVAYEIPRRAIVGRRSSEDIQRGE